MCLLAHRFALGLFTAIGLGFSTGVFAAPPDASNAAANVLALHSQNPHYFQWRGKPLVIISSAEHYGAVINLDFDYRKYLGTLAADGMNYTRIFTGAYVESSGAFNISSNTLAPAANRLVTPWARSDTPGFAGGGNKFDLKQLDPAYFERLKAFVTYAGEKGIGVEVTLFCPMYEETSWKASPMAAANNVNNVGNVIHTNVYTLDKDPALLAVQEVMARKVVRELNGFDNVFFEICNEPYWGNVRSDWQERIAKIVVETESELPVKHLIAQNIANLAKEVTDPNPAVSIFNFHYAAPPKAVAMNYRLNKVIGDDETGFRGTGDDAYRTEAWDFLLAGGALYNNLDYSFTVGKEDGTFAFPAKQPGGGGVKLRQQLKILSQFIHSFDFVRMKADDSVIKGGVPERGTARALVDLEKAIAIYVRKDTTGEAAKSDPVQLQIALPKGTWTAEWIDTKTGAITEPKQATGGEVVALTSPDFETDAALRLKLVDAESAK